MIFQYSLSNITGAGVQPVTSCKDTDPNIIVMIFTILTEASVKHAHKHTVFSSHSKNASPRRSVDYIRAAILGQKGCNCVLDLSIQCKLYCVITDHFHILMSKWPLLLSNEHLLYRTNVHMFNLYLGNTQTGPYNLLSIVECSNKSECIFNTHWQWDRIYVRGFKCIYSPWKGCERVCPSSYNHNNYHQEMLFL